MKRSIHSRYAGLWALVLLLSAPLMAEQTSPPGPATQTPAAPIPVDPLDAGRAGAMHRGPDPHAKLNAQQQITVALKHFSEGRLPQAMAVLDQAINRFPDDAELYHVRASIELSSGDAAGALSDVEKAVSMQPDKALYRVTRAQAYLKFERQQEALEDLNRAIALNPDLLPAYFNRGSLLAYQGKNQQALADFNQCIALDPHLPAPYFNRGSIYHTLGEQEKARADIEHFIQMASAKSWKQSGEDLLKAWDAEAKPAGEGK